MRVLGENEKRDSKDQTSKQLLVTQIFQSTAKVPCWKKTKQNKIIFIKQSSSEGRRKREVIPSDVYLCKIYHSVEFGMKGLYQVDLKS